jgi:hypothetical protein
VALCESRGRLQFYAGPEKARGCFNERRIVSNESPRQFNCFLLPHFFRKRTPCPPPFSSMNSRCLRMPPEFTLKSDKPLKKILENWLRFAKPQLLIDREYFSIGDLAHGAVASCGGAPLVAIELEQFRQRPPYRFG